jgi:predicted DNA-binding protein (UPF0251 family)
MADQGPSPDSTAVQTEDRERLGKALDTLSSDHRAIIMLSDVEGLAYREIAEVLDIPIGTVMSRLHNARKRLRQALTALLTAVLVVLLAWAGAPALAQGPPAAPAPTAPSPATVHFGARVYLASDGPAPANAPADLPSEPRVERYVLKLRQLFRYQQYHALQQVGAEVPVGVTHRAVLAGDRQLELTPEGMGQKTVRMRVRLVRGNITELTTHLEAPPGAATIIGGPRHGDGVLIILLWASTNPPR